MSDNLYLKTATPAASKYSNRGVMTHVFGDI